MRTVRVWIVSVFSLGMLGLVATACGSSKEMTGLADRKPASSANGYNAGVGAGGVPNGNNAGLGAGGVPNGNNAGLGAGGFPNGNNGGVGAGGNGTGPNNIQDLVNNSGGYNSSQVNDFLKKLGYNPANNNLVDNVGGGMPPNSITDGSRNERGNPNTLITDFGVLEECKLDLLTRTGDYSICWKCYDEWRNNGFKVAAGVCGCWKR